MANQRPRDNQRSRVYAWERAVLVKLAGRSLYLGEFTILDECEAFMAPIWRAERGRVGLAKMTAPSLARNLWGQRKATASADHVIKLPRWARSRWVILHEMAHRLTPQDEAHGPRFVGVLIGLAARWLDYDASQLMALADEMGVKYYVRSIGVVPHRGTAWHVNRTIRRHGAMSAMDIACHLSLVEGVDVSFKQVNGAAVSLISSGKAKWYRGRLKALGEGSTARGSDGRSVVAA